MTIKINVGLSRKVGQPNFGSLGASCHVDIELDAQAIRDEPERLQTKVREAFAVCKQSVDAELASSSQPDETPHGFAPPIPSPASRPHQDEAPPELRRGNGVARPATPAQVKAIHAIAGKAGIVVANELQHRFGVSNPQQLSLSQASQMIDHLKASLTPVPA